MKATEILMEEHEVILRVVTAMEKAAAAAPDGRVRPAFFLDAADFIKGFADGCHHAKEEKVLFKEMADAGFPVEGGPIGMMLMEHEQGRQYTRQMRAAAEKWQAGDASAIPEVQESALGYARLLRAHINKENTILFVMADRFLPQEKQSAVADGFEHVEHAETGQGVHEKYLALAEKLEQESSKY
ncbi:MAG TPA: hemerythrin domain-containing protein [Anaerolineales bacterium]|nr:hemerythrin domain-containing protein [Anaerolineales bacterium]